VLVLSLIWASPLWAHPELAEVQGAVDQLLTTSPDDPTLLIRQGHLREEAHDWDGALVSFTHALSHGGDADVIAAARAHVFLEAGFPRMATLEYDTLLAKQPDAFDILFERGRARLALGQVEAADRDFTRAVAHMRAPRPEHVIVHAQGWLKVGNSANALRALDDGIRRVGPLPSLLLTAVDLDVELQHYDEALARLDVLLVQTPTNEAWIARRADVLQQAGRAEEARAEQARALRQIESRPLERRSRATRELADRLRTQIGHGTGTKEGNL
jgi:predicted Zn-dependent protease